MSYIAIFIYVFRYSWTYYLAIYIRVNKMTVLCHSCNKTFEDYKELALHISANRKGHKKGRKWAAKYIMLNGLSPKNRFEQRKLGNPLTAEQRAIREDNKRILSSDNEYVNTICPKCKKGGRRLLPVEYTKSKTAWRIKSNLVILCQNCGGKA